MGRGETKATLKRILMNSAPACPFGMLIWQGEKLWCLLLVILLVKSQVHKSYPVGFILFKGYSMYLAHPGPEADSAGPCSLVLFGDGLGFGRVMKMYCHHWGKKKQTRKTHFSPSMLPSSLKGDILTLVMVLMISLLCNDWKPRRKEWQ